MIGAARDRVLRVPLAREHDRDGDRVGELGTRHPGELAGRGGEEQTAERRHEARQHDLRLRVAEACVELDHPDAVFGDDESAVQQSDERGALGLQLQHGRERDRLDHLVDEALGQPRQRGVGAHAAGVRALVVIEDALVVLSRSERQHRVAVAQEEERDFLSGEELLDEHGSEAEVVGGVLDRGHAVRRDEHPSPAASPSAFTT